MLSGLAEDEAIIRRGIRDSIDWEANGLEFVGEAGDGEYAYPLILKTDVRSRSSRIVSATRFKASTRLADVMGFSR